jgi:ribosomal protein L16/L10AE
LTPFARRGKAALLDGNLETLAKLVTKGKKLLPEVVQDRRQKVHLAALRRAQCELVMIAKML